jgi:biopolymer transport protein ExbD
MAGVDVGGKSGGRRSVDQEINMIPFIDLLMVTVSFLLITAVWSSMARLETHAAVPSTVGKIPMKDEPTVLQVRAKEGRFVLEWQTGTKVEDIATVPMIATADGRYPELEDAVKKAYAVGQSVHHLQGDVVSSEKNLEWNSAVVHVDARLPLGDVTRIIDAVSTPQRRVGKTSIAAFAVTFSMS